MSWIPIIVTVVGCFLFKLTGTLLPDRLLNEPRIAAMAALLPVALIASITALSTFATEQQLALDARLAGLAVAAVAIALKAPFIVVVLSAAATTAAVRAL